MGVDERFTALVTGAAGFIGSHLVDALLVRGCKVVGFDNFSTGSRDNLRLALKHEAFTLISGDIRDAEAVKEACRGVDVVFHLAAVTKVSESIRKPHKYQEINVEGTLNVVTGAAVAGVKRIVFASSAAVYGNPTKIPTPENVTPNPYSPYGASKLAAELFCQTVGAHHGLEVVPLRLFNVYGPRQATEDDAGVVGIFIHRALSGQPIIIFGDGGQTRDFIYVEDVVEAMMNAATVPLPDRHPINVGTGHPITIRRLAEEVLRQCRSNQEIITRSSRPGDIYRSVASVERMRKILGFKARYDLRHGLRKTIEAEKVG